MGNTADNKPKEEVNDVVMKRLDEMETGLKADLEASNKKVKELTDTVKKLSNKDDQSEDDIVDTERKSANIMSFPVIDGAPIVKSKMTKVVSIKGVEIMAEVTTADGKEYKIPVGCDMTKLDFTEDNLKDVHQTSFENLETVKFKLIDIAEGDLTGASKVQLKKIIHEGSLIPEISRTSGSPVPTGRKIRTVVRRDIRHYTIKYNDKKFTFTGEELANIRK